jgi:hypothetical protein
MPIQGACPACGVPLQVPDASVGRSFQCVRCGTSLATMVGGQIVMQPPGFAPASPFAPANPFAESAQGGYFAPSQYAGYAPRMTREQALAKAAGPAILLMIYGVLWVLGGLAFCLLLLAPEAQEDQALLYIVLIFAPLCVAVGAFTMFSGWQMMRLRSYGLIMAAVIVTIGLGLLTCPMLAIIVVWPMAVLLDVNVKQHFGTAQ